MDHNQEQTHDLSYKEPIIIFLCLIVLTLFTVAVAGKIEYPTLSLLAALGIASVKAFLVIRYFMHLKYEHWLFSVFLAVALGTFGVIFLLLFTDYGFRW